MNEAVDKLLKAALLLTDEEQLELLSALQSAVEERGLWPFDDSWLGEIQRRSEEYDAGLVRLISWPEVKERARRKATGRG